MVTNKCNTIHNRVGGKWERERENIKNTWRLRREEVKKRLCGTYVLSGLKACLKLCCLLKLCHFDLAEDLKERNYNNYMQYNPYQTDKTSNYNTMTCRHKCSVFISTQTPSIAKIHWHTHKYRVQLTYNTLLSLGGLRLASASIWTFSHQNNIRK